MFEYIKNIGFKAVLNTYVMGIFFSIECFDLPAHLKQTIWESFVFLFLKY